MKPLFLLHFSAIIMTCAGQSMPSQQLNQFPEKYANDNVIQKRRQNVRIVFYNVENLYDPYNDSLKMDDEFTPAGVRHWTWSRFREKLNHVAKTFLAMGKSEPPAIIGMCEVENKYVLNKLVHESPLQRFTYRIIHHESPDLRGVDVAMIYRPDKFSPVTWQAYPVRFPFDTVSQTREILMVKGILFETDTIYLFINHWPSRRGGYKESQPRRNYVASRVRSICDSLFQADQDSRIILMGDLNDEPDKESLVLYLNTKQDTINIKPTDLINLMFPKMRRWDEGTIKYQGQWSIFDQFIVSGNLITGSSGITTSFRDAQIFNSPVLTIEDGKNFGVRLNRTYTGPRYTGGFSDHLPIFLDLWKSDQELGH